MAKRRVVWRVYEAWFVDDEVGTMEYGYYTSHDRARARTRETWNRDRPHYGDPVEYADGSLGTRSDSGDYRFIYVAAAPLDVDLEDECILN